MVIGQVASSLSSDAFAMRCLELTWGVLLPGWEAVRALQARGSREEAHQGEDAICLAKWCLMPSTDVVYLRPAPYSC